PVGGAQPDRFPRHAEDHATGFILRDGPRSSALHLEESFGSVGSHSGQDHADRIPSGCFSDRMEQHIHGRPLITNARTVLYGDAILGAALLKSHVKISRSDQSLARNDTISVCRFFNSDAAQIV